MNSRPLLALLLLTALTVGGQVSAAESKRSSPAAQRDARRAYEKGAQLYRSGQYEGAIAAFRQAYALQPHPALLFNIAQAQEKLGELDGALESYRGYLAGAPEAKDRAAVEAAIANLEERLAAEKIQSLHLRSTPSKATVTVNGAPSGLTPVTLQLPVGSHDVLLELEGYEAAKRAVTLTRESAVQLDVTLAPLPAPEGPKRLWTWVALGTSAALAASAATVGFLASQDADNLRRFQHDQAQVNQLHDGARDKAFAANILYGVSGAALVAGGALFFVEGRF